MYDNMVLRGDKSYILGEQSYYFENMNVFYTYTLEAIWRIKLKICRNVHSISFNKDIVILLLLHVYFGCYSSLKFPYTYNRENDNWL